MWKQNSFSPHFSVFQRALPCTYMPYQIVLLIHFSTFISVTKNDKIPKSQYVGGGGGGSPGVPCFSDTSDNAGGNLRIQDAF